MCDSFSLSPVLLRVQDAQLLGFGHTLKKQHNNCRMINGCCFLAPNVSHYNPIQHHLSFAWSISSIPLSITRCVCVHNTQIFNLLDQKLHDFWSFSFFFFFSSLLISSVPHYSMNRLHNSQPTICDHDAFIRFIAIDLL